MAALVPWATTKTALESMYHKMAIYRSLAILALAACFPQDTSSQERPVITMERTACYGTCPVYKLTIFRDGRVFYDGREYVAVKEKREARISEATVELLVGKFLEADYFSLKDQYRVKENPDGGFTFISDQPTTYTTLEWQGKRKTVENYAFAPEILDQLEYEIDKAVNAHQWLHKDNLRNYTDVGVDIYSGIKLSLTTLMEAAGKGDLDLLAKRIEAGEDVNARDETGWTALMLAAVRCQEKAIQLLLESGAQPWARDENGDTALIGAVSGFCKYHEDEEAEGTGDNPTGRVMRMLIDRGAGANEANFEGLTPLMIAARWGLPEVVRTLLQLGADPACEDKRGKTALRHAQEAWKACGDDCSREDDFVKTMEILAKGN